MKPRQNRPRGAATRNSAEGTVLEGRVRDVTDAGDSVVETTRGVVMVTGGLPDEQVRLRVTGGRSGVLHGALLGVLSASPQRIEAACALTDKCGGCPLMTLDQSGQRSLKQRRVERAVAGLAETELQVVFESAGTPFGYRRRARLAFRKLGSGLVLGYRAHGQNQLVDVPACPVLTNTLQSALALVREVMGPVLTGAGEVELDSLNDSQVHVALRCDAAMSPSVYQAAELLATRAPIAGVALSVEGGAPARYGETEQAHVDDDGVRLVARAHGFSQVNRAVNVRLRELVMTLAQPAGQRVLELYCGHGNFTIGLAGQAEQLLAVEGEPSAVEACRANLRARSLSRAHVLASDVRSLAVRERYDVVVLDPPRGGCPSLAALAQQAKPSRVVYVSCHMTTLSRDLRALHAAGFRAERAHALDMFPQTGHVEAVVLMQRMTS